MIVAYALLRLDSQSPNPMLNISFFKTENVLLFVCYTVKYVPFIIQKCSTMSLVAGVYADPLGELTLSPLTG